MLQQFHLLISLIARMNPFSGCSHCLETSQVVWDANQLTGFYVMGIFFEGSSQEICKTIFFVNRILLLLPVLRLALNIYGLFGIFHVILFQYSGLCSPSWQTFWQICLFWSRIDVYWRCSLVCICRLIWSNFVGQWEFSIANILFSI